MKNTDVNRNEVEYKVNTREVIRETIVEGPPGIHGVIIEFDFLKSKEPNVTTADCLKFYSLRSI